MALLLLLGLTSCAGTTDDNEPPSEGQQAVLADSMRGSLRRAIDENKYPLDLTQSEFQDDGEGVSCS